jgi:hypothetical protein
MDYKTEWTGLKEYLIKQQLKYKILQINDIRRGHTFGREYWAGRIQETQSIIEKINMIDS